MTNKKKRIGIAIGIVAVLLLAAAAVLYVRYRIGRIDNDSLHVVILDSEGFYYSETGIEQGIQTAMEDIADREQFPITYDLIEDDGSYVKGIAIAKQLAEDPTVDAVITLQNFDSIDAEMPYFEEAEKPFIVTMGCYDQVAEQGYDYLLADFLSARLMGEKIGEMLVDLDARNVALCHSDTMFERDTIRGILSVLDRSPNCRVCYSETGPFNDTELSDMLTQYKLLGVDTVVANFYTQEDSEWLLKKLAQNMTGLVRVGDYVLDNSGVLKEYGSYLEGVYIVPNYPYAENEEMEDFKKRYEKRSHTDFTTTAIQYYDLFMMLSKCCDGRKVSGKQLMAGLKDEDGYQGVGGMLRYDENGRLLEEDCPVFRCHNSRFQVYNGGEEK